MARRLNAERRRVAADSFPSEDDAEFWRDAAWFGSSTIYPLRYNEAQIYSTLASIEQMAENLQDRIGFTVLDERGNEATASLIDDGLEYMKSDIASVTNILRRVYEDAQRISRIIDDDFSKRRDGA
jgi:hypothetical protein